MFDRRISSLKSKNNRILIVFVAMVIAIMIDSQVGIVADFIAECISSLPGILLYVSLTIFLILSSFYFIYHIKSIEKLMEVKYIYFKLVFNIIVVLQILIAIMLTSVVLQIVIYQEYHTSFLSVITLLVMELGSV